MNEYALLFLIVICAIGLIILLDWLITKHRSKTLYDVNKLITRKNLQPYVIIIENTTNKPKKAVLFGHDKHIRSENYGSDSGVVLTSFSTNSYGEILEESKTKPFLSALMRITTTDLDQIDKSFTYIAVSGSGTMASVPIMPDSYMHDDQVQKSIVDIPYRLQIDGGKRLEFEILPKNQMTVTFFPESQFSLGHILRQLEKTDMTKDSMFDGVPETPLESFNEHPKPYDDLP